MFLKIQIQLQIIQKTNFQTDFFSFSQENDEKHLQKGESVFCLKESPPIKFNNSHLYNETKTNRETKKIKNIGKVNFNHLPDIFIVNTEKNYLT